MKKTLITTSIIAALFAVPAMAEGKPSPTPQAETAETAQKTVTSKYYVDQELATKQDTISTNKVLFLEADGRVVQENIYVPALVATNAAGTTLNGNTIGVVDYSSYGALEADWSLETFYDDTFDSFVPTVRAVAEALNTIRNDTVDNILNFSTDETTATNNYSTLFDGQNGNWPSNDANNFVKGGAFATGLALKQNKIAAGNAGEVVTYTGTAGSVGSVAVASTETYNNQNQLTNGSNIANVQLVSTKQDKMTCAGYVPGHENDINYCWLYGDVQVATSSCFLYGESATSASQCCSGYLQSGENKCGCRDDDLSVCPACNRGETTMCLATHKCACILNP